MTTTTDTTVESKLTRLQEIQASLVAKYAPEIQKVSKLSPDKVLTEIGRIMKARDDEASALYKAEREAATAKAEHDLKALDAFRSYAKDVIGKVVHLPTNAVSMTIKVGKDENGKATAPVADVKVDTSKLEAAITEAFTPEWGKLLKVGFEKLTAQKGVTVAVDANGMTVLIGSVKRASTGKSKGSGGRGQQTTITKDGKSTTYPSVNAAVRAVFPGASPVNGPSGVQKLSKAGYTVKLS